MLDDRADNIDTSFRLCPQQHPQISTQISTLRTLKSNHAVIRAIQESTSPQDTEYDLILDLLNGLKPCTIGLQGTVMPNSSTFPPPPASSSPRSAPPLPDTTPSTKVPSIATRRAACTHLTMERLYGDFTCNICSRYPTFGWVYCCTQDEVPENHIIPDSVPENSNPPHQYVNGSGNDAKGTNDPSMPTPAMEQDFRLGREDILMPTAQLSPWIERAIKDGHYMPEQVIKLRAQKQHVVETAKAAIHQFEQSQNNKPQFPSQTPTTLRSVDMNPHLPYPVINQVQEPSTTCFPTAKATLARQAKSRMFPFCKFCACHLCRPTHRDRTWQRFDDIFEAEYDIPFIDYEDGNRPMASRSIMSTIGLHPPQLPPQRPILRAADSTALYSRNEAGQLFFNNNNNESYRKSTDPTRSSTDVVDMSIEADGETKGFRESMKRALKGMLTTRQPLSSNKKRKARDGTDTTEEDAVEFDMGLWKELNDELLREASGVPLPVGGKDSIEGLSKGIAGTGLGGVTVTEEAADLGTADVIMSV